ncbi:MAG: flagellar biosynthetic protein FliQ [Candidatus Eremiobacteraeota bacterium]|nr:flagellar biosynthetic protein FliQ [Candidatus Eremiobacteraeota bacterium]
MTRVDLLQLAREMLVSATMVATPVLIVVAVVGLAISLVQALTQIQEQSLSFVPKMLAGIGTLLALSPWMIGVLVTLATRIMSSIGGPLS